MGITGPPGEILLSADQDGFEVRLLADLSRDPLLLAASQHRDIHAELAKQFSGTMTVSRAQSKLGMLALMYGQKRDDFWRSRADMRIADATECAQPESAATSRP